MDYKDLANLIFPNVDKTIECYEQLYPNRNLKEGAIVTRYAPSPTGFIHIGALLASFTESTFAKQTNGVFYLRIEDTDTKRTVNNGINLIIDGLNEFGVTFDEGPLEKGKSKGNYGPYIQSERKEIYQTYAKHLIEIGLAYPCFCSQKEINDVRDLQSNKKERIGYYGKWAKCRSLTLEEACAKIKNGEKPIIRFKSTGNFDKKIYCNDEIRGTIVFPENDLDIVIIKSDGLPTYHFAHVIDDHLMHTTHVIRGDEWLSSLPIHVQLFNALGFKIPKYAHISPLCKIDEATGNIRKVSKRKDPEFAMSYYHEQGIPYESVMMYLANITSSSFEEWLSANPNGKVSDFKFSFKKMQKSGALFDLTKLMNISKNFISRLSAEELYNRTVNYLKEYNKEFYTIFSRNPEYTKQVLNIEREQKKPRKDIGKYSDVYNETCYMYDECFNPNYTDYIFDGNMYLDYITNYFNINDDKNTWFEKITTISEKYGYGTMRNFKEHPELYIGNVGDFCEGLRYIITERKQTPDLYEITRILGRERIINRINNYNNYNKNVKKKCRADRV